MISHKKYKLNEIMMLPIIDIHSTHKIILPPSFNYGSPSV